MAFPPRIVRGGLASSVLGRLAVRPCLGCRDHARPQHQIFVLDAFIPIAHLNCSILPLSDQCLALCRSVPPVLRLELQKMPAVLRHPIVDDPCVVLAITMRTSSGGMEGVRPGRGASCSSPAIPSCRKRDASEQQCAARSKVGGQSSGPACLRWPATQSGRAAQPGPEHCARAHRSLALLFARWSELHGGAIRISRVLQFCKNTAK
jgi:hypothetical protein